MLCKKSIVGQEVLPKLREGALTDKDRGQLLTWETSEVLVIILNSTYWKDLR